MIKSFKPNSELSHIIKEFYVISIENIGETKSIPILDDCCHDIIFYSQAKAELIYGEMENVQRIECHLFTILGLTPPYVLKYEDELSFFTIKFQPWMNHFFFGHIRQTGIVNLEEDYPALNSILNETENRDKIKNILKNSHQYFIDQNIELSPKVEMVKLICEFIYDKKGLVKVKDVSTHFGKSRQYINKIFKEEVMCSLKTFLTSVRIVALVKQKSKSEELNLTQLAYDYGYFDQAHFINDFKKVCGVTPGQYFGDLPDFILRHD
jgi:AraC-like DNA-binding protein